VGAEAILDEVAVYDRALSPAEVKTIADGNRPSPR
jgi:hypothetical protein